LAGRQHGIVTRRQLLDLGLDDDDIGYRTEVGRLIRLHRGVYAVGHRPPSMQSRAMAAVLACGEGAVLSHVSAAALWNVGPRWTVPMDVTVPGDRRPKGIRVHRAPGLAAPDVTVHFGIPVTSPARTALDLAGRLDDKALTRAVNQARLNGHLRLPDLKELLARSPGRPTRSLERLVEHATGPTRSELEDEFLRFVERYGFPRPEVNQVVAGHEVDMLWREQRLIVELDSRAHHDGDEPFETDRDRDADLLVAGFSVVRITWRRLTTSPDREASRLRALLRPRRTSATPATTWSRPSSRS
jgi:very-short-patch-repair endonuclease